MKKRLHRGDGSFGRGGVMGSMRAEFDARVGVREELARFRIHNFRERRSVPLVAKVGIQRCANDTTIEKRVRRPVPEGRDRFFIGAPIVASERADCSLIYQFAMGILRK
jgi:hypothetical protein